MFCNQFFEEDGLMQHKVRTSCWSEQLLSDQWWYQRVIASISGHLQIGSHNQRHLPEDWSDRPVSNFLPDLVRPLLCLATSFWQGRQKEERADNRNAADDLDLEISDQRIEQPGL